MKVSMRKIEGNLSYYLNQVKAGKNVIITSNKIPIAIMQSLPKQNNRIIDDLIRIGYISWNGKKPKGLSNPPKMKGKPPSKIILEDRS